MRSFVCIGLLLLLAAPVHAGLGDPPTAPVAAGLPDPRPPESADAWKVVKEVDQVVVERAASNQEKTPWSRGTARIEAPFSRVVGHILDFGNLVRFVPKIIEARVLDQSGDRATVYYRLDLPWPLSDRHWTVAYQWRIEEGHFTMAWSDANHKQPPGVKKAVLIEIVRGTWELWRDGDGATRGQIVQLIALGGGWMPKSVIEETVWKQPLETFRGMRKALK